MTVSFAVVAYNEEKTLPALLKAISAQDYPHEKIEIILVDSISKDSTEKIMQDFANSENNFSNILVLKNHKKNIPSGCNIALSAAKNEIFMRIDAHAVIPHNFISNSVAGIKAGEDICGGKVESLPVKDTPWHNTMLIAETSFFCGGVAGFRRLEKTAYVDTLAFAAYKKEVFNKVGFYNEYFPRSEDNEMNYRIRSAGFKLYFDPSIRSQRFSRSTFKALVKQKYLNGYWIGKTIGICPQCFSAYHFIPFTFVLGIIFTSILALFGILWPAYLMWGLYSLCDITASVMEISKRKFHISNLLLPIIFPILHIGYGIGTLLGLIEMPFWLLKVKKFNKQ